jgi:predicted phosphodiesterase
MVYLFGDLHGEITRFQKKYFGHSGVKKSDQVIVLGDFGIPFTMYHETASNSDLSKLNDLSRRKYDVLYLDGNHDNHQYINSLPSEIKYGNSVHTLAPGLYHLKRGLIYQIDGKSLLTIGGGLSIDKAMRRAHISWWPEEELSDDEIKTIEESLKAVNYEVDYVLTHTPPQRIIREIIGSGGTLYEDKTSTYFDSLRSVLKFKAWFFGHMHVDYWEPPFYGLYDQRFIKLDLKSGAFEAVSHYKKISDDLSKNNKTMKTMDVKPRW